MRIAGTRISYSLTSLLFEHKERKRKKTCVHNMRGGGEVIFYTSANEYNTETKTCLYLCENHFINNSTELGRAVTSHTVNSD
jgi:hypothetical protein